MAVPYVVGQAGDAAKDALIAAGRAVEFDAGSQTVIVESNWVVDAQTPTSMAQVAKGSTVTLQVTKPKLIPTPTPEAPKQQAPKQEAPQQEAPRQEAPKQEVQKPADTAVTYANCDAARAAGAAPISVGEPGYAKKLDRDGDGVACE